MGSGMSKRPQEVKIELVEPIEWGDETITELVMNRPKGKHLRKLPAEPDTGDMLDFAANLCNQPPPMVNEMDVDDIAALIEAVEGFLPQRLRTGDS